MKLKHIVFAGLAVVTIGIAGAKNADAASYQINDEFNLGPNEGSSQRAVPNAVVLHETANETATGRNEATFMKRNWMNAYTTDIVGDGGIVYRIGEQGYVSYGAGNFNGYAPVQIELQHTHDKNLFAKNYKAYVEYARDSAKRFNIPLTLDQGNSVNSRGIKSHLWISNNIWGDHSDPYGYLAEMGVSKAKLANDLMNGFSGGSTTTPTTPSKPVQASNPLTAGSHYSVMNDKNAHAHIDEFGQVNNKLKARGWHIANYQYEYIFAMDARTGKELARVKAPGKVRSDVNKAYKTSGNVGFDVMFNTSKLKGKRVYIMMRATNDPTGNQKGGSQDFHETRWYHDIK